MSVVLCPGCDAWIDTDEESGCVRCEIEVLSGQPYADVDATERVGTILFRTFLALLAILMVSAFAGQTVEAADRDAAILEAR